MPASRSFRTAWRKGTRGECGTDQPPTDRCPGCWLRGHRVLRVTALVGLMAASVLALTWELSAPVGGADSLGRAMPQPGALAQPSPERRPGASPGGADTAVLGDLVASIAARPLFSLTRRGDDHAVEKSPWAVSEDGLPRLSGVIVGPDGRRAIFAGTDGKSRAASEGEMVGAFKVRSIEPGVVNLSGPNGERVLRPTFIITAKQKTAAPAVGNDLPGRPEGGQ